jgi:hypothetical protein
MCRLELSNHHRSDNRSLIEPFIYPLKGKAPHVSEHDACGAFAMQHTRCI